MQISLFLSVSLSHLIKWRSLIQICEKRLSHLPGLPYLPSWDNSSRFCDSHVNGWLNFSKKQAKRYLGQGYWGAGESCLRYPTLFKMVPYWHWWRVDNRVVTDTAFPVHLFLMIPPFLAWKSQSHPLFKDILHYYCNIPSFKRLTYIILFPFLLSTCKWKKRLFTSSHIKSLKKPNVDKV